MVLFMNFTDFLSDLEAYLLHTELSGTIARNHLYNYLKSRPSITLIWLCYRSNHVIYTLIKTNDIIYRELKGGRDDIVFCFLTCLFYIVQKSLVHLGNIFIF